MTAFIIITAIYVSCGIGAGIGDRVSMANSDERGDWSTTAMIAITWPLFVVMVIVDSIGGEG